MVFLNFPPAGERIVNVEIGTYSRSEFALTCWYFLVFFLGVLFFPSRNLDKTCRRIGDFGDMELMWSGMVMRNLGFGRGVVRKGNSEREKKGKG